MTDEWLIRYGSEDPEIQEWVRKRQSHYALCSAEKGSENLWILGDPDKNRAMAWADARHLFPERVTVNIYRRYQ